MNLNPRVTTKFMEAAQSRGFNIIRHLCKCVVGIAPRTELSEDAQADVVLAKFLTARHHHWGGRLIKLMDSAGVNLLVGEFDWAVCALLRGPAAPQLGHSHSARRGCQGGDVLPQRHVGLDLREL